jgi:CBS domain-containing protein
MRNDHLEWFIDHLDIVEFPKDTIIIEPGKTCDALYFIHTGAIQLEAMGSSRGEQKILAELVEGESFPLEALEENRPVFSTFRTKEETVCYRLSITDFTDMKEQSTVFAEFCKYRAASFLEQSRRVYRLHFSHQSEEQQRLSLPLSLLMRPKPLTAAHGETIRTVVKNMYDQDVDAAVIINGNKGPTGIFTMRDLLRKVVVPGGDLNGAVENAMTASPTTLPVTALGYQAAMIMAEEGFHHVVVEEGGKLAGIVTERDLFNLQRVSLAQINAEIRSAVDLDRLKNCCRDIELLAENMLVQGVTADQITQIISTLNDQVIGRVLNLELNNENFDGIKVCWIALGSEGRLEQTFATDQDNAIIFEATNGTLPEEVRQRLLPVALRVNKAMDKVGFPLCKGNIMASNPACCLSYKEWQQKFMNWMEMPTPEAILNSTIFFDFRQLYGEHELSDRLRLWLSNAAKGQSRFFHLLAENALQRTPPLGFFRDFIVEDHKEHPNTIDIKLNGVTMFVDAARCYALACGVTRSNTKQRLMTAGDLRKWPQSEVNAWAEAFSFLQTLRIRHQFELQRNGNQSHNRINPYELNNLDRKFFLEALRQAGKLQKQLSADFSIGGM